MCGFSTAFFITDLQLKMNFVVFPHDSCKYKEGFGQKHML